MYTDRFHYQDGRGHTIDYGDGVLMVTSDRHKGWTSTTDFSRASVFLAWAVRNGVNSAITYHNSGEMYL